MSKIQVETTLDTSAFIKSVAQLQLPELEVLASELESVIASKQTDKQALSESELLKLINGAVLEETKRRRYIFLSKKLEEDSLSDQEHAEYLSIVEADEKLRNERLVHLISLSRMRGISLDELMRTLQIA